MWPGITDPRTNDAGFSAAEYFVHIDPDDLPKDLVVVGVDVPDRVSGDTIAVARFAGELAPEPGACQPCGRRGAFAAGRKVAILIVPSVLVPSETNWLINPGHPEFGDIRVQPPEPFH